MRKATKSIVFDGSAGRGEVGSTALFRITGAVRLIPFAIVTQALESAGDTATLEVGVEGRTESVISQFNQVSAGDGRVATAGNSDDNIDYLVNNGQVEGVLASGGSTPLNILMTVGTEDITAGRVTIGFMWESLIPGSSVHTF